MNMFYRTLYAWHCRYNCWSCLLSVLVKFVSLPIFISSSIISKLLRVFGSCMKSYHKKSRTLQQLYTYTTHKSCWLKLLVVSLILCSYGLNPTLNKTVGCWQKITFALHLRQFNSKIKSFQHANECGDNDDDDDGVASNNIFSCKIFSKWKMLCFFVKNSETSFFQRHHQQWHQMTTKSISIVTHCSNGVASHDKVFAQEQFVRFWGRAEKHLNIVWTYMNIFMCI